MQIYELSRNTDKSGNCGIYLYFLWASGSIILLDFSGATVTTPSVISTGLNDPKKSETGTAVGSLLNKSVLTPTVERQ